MSFPSPTPGINHLQSSGHENDHKTNLLVPWKLQPQQERDRHDNNCEIGYQIQDSMSNVKADLVDALTWSVRLPKSTDW